jgi:hypothetical protein
MQKYDVALKNVLMRGQAGFLSRILEVDVAQFLNAELPEVRSLRVDLLGEARDGRLFQVELQSTNDTRMAFRMLDYLVTIERGFGRVARQLVLYVGEAPMRMTNRIEVGRLSYEFEIVDVRDIDGVPLLDSDSLDENILSILARLPDRRMAVRRILEKIAAGDSGRRAAAATELMILAGLRSLGSFVEEESRKMPILTDIMDHDVFGPLWKRGIAEGRVEGERAFFLKLAAKRFGTLPDWVSEQVGSLGVEELEDLGVRLLDATSPDELFGRI